jgi:hypothetical protein
MPIGEQNRFKLEERERIVELLEDCIAEPDLWKAIVIDLRENLKLLRYAHSDYFRVNLSNLLNACASEALGYQYLLKRVHFYAKGTTAWLQLAQYSFQVLAQFPEELRRLGDELVQEAESMTVSPPLIKRICKEVGAEVEHLPVSTCFDAILQLFQLPDKYHSGLQFIYRLADEEAGLKNRQALRSWVEKAARELSIPEQSIKGLKASSTAENHLLILIQQVNPEASQFKVNCWLEIEGAIRLMSPEPERLYSLSAIGNEIEELATKVLNKLGPDFVVELVVKGGVFCHDITKWQVKVGQTCCWLVEEVPVVFRSLERFEARRNEKKRETQGMSKAQEIFEELLNNTEDTNPVNLAGWREKWNAVRDFGDQEVDRLVRHIEPMGQNIDNLWEELRETTEGLCVSLGFVPDADTETRKLFTTVLDRGTPIVISFREIPGGKRIDVETLRQKILNQIPEQQHRVRLSELRSHLWKVFKRAAKGEHSDIGRYVMLLYDDYDRVPPHPGNYRKNPQE